MTTTTSKILNLDSIQDTNKEAYDFLKETGHNFASKKYKSEFNYIDEAKENGFVLKNVLIQRGRGLPESVTKTKLKLKIMATSKHAENIKFNKNIQADKTIKDRLLFNRSLIRNAVKTFGTYDPNQIIPYIEESLTMLDIKIITGFMIMLCESNDGFNADTYQNKVEEFIIYNNNILNNKNSNKMKTTTETPAKKTATNKSTVKNSTKTLPKAVKGKTAIDYSIRSYQELAKMYGNGFVGMSKASIIEALEARNNN